MAENLPVSCSAIAVIEDLFSLSRLSSEKQTLKIELKVSNESGAIHYTAL